MKIHEITTKKSKAGIIPWVIEDGEIKMMFMIPSNPKYGGPSPQIAKGGIDPGEDAAEAAVREGFEELGLLKNNIEQIIKIASVTISGLDETYPFTIFAAKVKNRTNFGSPHFETGKTLWLTNEEFQSTGRNIHKQLVASTFKKLNIK
jgi:8-oxo-dGTP pyrophosphatase MutT (NUDIX family)